MGLKRAFKKATRIATKPVSSTLRALGTSGGKIGALAMALENAPDQATAKALEKLAPLATKLQKLEQVTKLDKKLADKTGWKWLQGKTAKTQQSTSRALESFGNFINSVGQGTAQAFKEGEGLDLQRANQIRLEADRGHIRTNTGEDIQKGLQSGMYKLGPDGQVYDRYGGRIGEKGLAQRGTTALQVASIVMPALAPLAAAASTATAARHGTPVGKALAQGALSYYAGKFPGVGEGLVQHATRGALQGGVGGGISAYNAGARGGDLFKEAGKGALTGGVLAGAGGYVAPQAGKAMTDAGVPMPVAKATVGGGMGALTSALRGGDVSRGLITGAAGGVGGHYGGRTGRTLATGTTHAYLNSRDAKRRGLA